MPKYHMSPQQEMKFMQVLSGDIPLTAVAQYNMNSFKYNVSDWTDYYKEMSMGSISLDRDREIKKHQGIVTSWQDTHTQLVEQDRTARFNRINREACATNIFYRAMNEGDWETAKSMTEEYAPLKKIYETERKAKEIEQGFIKLMLDGYEEGIAYQCVAFIKGFAQLLEADISTSDYGSGYEAAGSVARKSNNIFHETSYTKGMNIPAGTLLSNKAPTGKYGHVFAVLKDIGDYVIAVEQAGELAEGDAPYDPAAGIGPKAQGYKWHDNSALYWYNANERYRSYYNEDTKTHMLTMMPGITLIPKSYLEDGRKVNMAVPDEASSQAVAKTVRKLGLGSLNDPKKVEKFNETWWKSLGGR